MTNSEPLEQPRSVHYRHGTGYLLTYSGPKRVLAHRYAWEQHFGAIPEGYVVHHIDGDKANNSIDNLRCVDLNYHSRVLHKNDCKGRGIGTKNKQKPDCFVKRERLVGQTRLVHVRMSYEEHLRIKEQSNLTHREVSAIIREAIEQYYLRGAGK